MLPILQCYHPSPPIISWSSRQLLPTAAWFSDMLELSRSELRGRTNIEQYWEKYSTENVIPVHLCVGQILFQRRKWRGKEVFTPMRNNQPVQRNSFLLNLGSRILKVRVREGNLRSIFVLGIDPNTCTLPIDLNTRALPVPAWMNLTNKRVNSLASTSRVLRHVCWTIRSICPPCRASENTTLSTFMRDTYVFAAWRTHSQCCSGNWQTAGHVHAL